MFKNFEIKEHTMSNFDKLWEEFNEKLLYYIKSRVSNSHDAEDILQIVFIKIFNSIDKLENKDAIKSWIYKITRNSIIDFYKKNHPLTVSPESFFDLKDEIDYEDNMNEDISTCIRKMIFTLPEKYHKVYDMYENKEMKHKEIAEALDISVSASKVRLKRSKEMFKEKLINCCDFETDRFGNIIDYKQKSDCIDCESKKKC
jgi:RNA polymerase sigma-70 factor (ECF subfamily)